MRVSKEQAVILKALGFDLPTKDYYFSNYNANGEYIQDYIVDDGIILCNYNGGYWGKDCYSAPELHAVCDWLRTKGLHVYVVPSNELKVWGGWFYRIVGKDGSFQGSVTMNTYDEALSAAITRALEILKEQSA